MWKSEIPYTSINRFVYNFLKETYNLVYILVRQNRDVGGIKRNLTGCYIRALETRKDWQIKTPGLYSFFLTPWTCVNKCRDFRVGWALFRELGVYLKTIKDGQVPRKNRISIHLIKKDNYKVNLAFDLNII